ncbi:MULTISPECIES: LysR family transcriptional regulator [Pantoea]|jgi:DNA-binding transcriptional LysR family regulator|uniref:LysR family transcriptional regulator n=1 Tax=Pantoea brenneri TaxID=472694 RepID=A0A7Y6TRN8_9GAMM|nr:MULTISPECIES: LysR family transcriptional regulator [Pantoea]MBZ6394651.1 LysR family transcriptional regulator [Pantoea sp.]MBZ6440373.1 LysR family transcriptional regulator [Pantoea sp.]MCQ5471764.1 LysR family transcriptional regulator [Pantoea brenneri]MDU4746838.1 LysR family transcriptional regulator [Pantoea sp.]NUY41440.1 LysR family transcriptional regulator [Pantoea brenneri]
MENSANLTAMLVFARVVELQSFSEAARALGWSKSHVSREIARLELRLGIRLLQRTTRRLALTELGQAYYPYCVRMLAEVQRADAFVQQLHQQPAGNVRLQAPVTYGCQCVVPVLNRFLRRHLHINVDLDLTDRNRDTLDDQIDVAIVIRSRPPQQGNFRVLSDIEWGLYAAPGYLAQRPAIEHPEMLPRHDLLLFHGPAHTAALPFRRDKQRLALDVRSRFRANNSMALLNAALAGSGIAYLPSYMAQEAVSRGDIQQLLPEWQMDRLQSYLLLRETLQPASPVSLLCDTLIAALASA